MDSKKKFEKSYFDVMGICCSSEIPLINNALKHLDGIIEVNVIVTSRTVIVIHDNQLISQIQIVRALKSARFEANVRVYGQQEQGNKWPKPYTIACGILVVVSTFKYVYHPLVWVGLGAVAMGILPILLRSMAAVRNRNFDVNILMLVAVIGAIVLGDYWEAGATVFLFTVAEWLESRASQKANVGMSSLMSMAPQKAVLAETGETIDAKDIQIGTILAVKTGEVIPIDGIVRDGKCEVDEKTLTGEPLPVTKQAESTVWAGTINLNGYITVRTTALAEDCVVAKMAKLVEDAQNSKSKTQRLVDQFAKYYTPVVVLASLLIFIVPVAMRKHDIRHWAHLALVVLVSACPCALILSTPVATFCAFTKAATDGILIKGGDHLETLGKIKNMAFDKTGTITRGEFSVTDFRSTNPDASLNTLLFWVSSIESKASHPMAEALVDYAEMNSVKPKPESVKEFQNYPGEGIYGEIDGRNIYIGNRKIARRVSCETVPLEGDDGKGETLGYVFSGEHQIGVFSMADTCRTGVLEAIKELKSLGIQTAMLTGDSKSAAMQVHDKLGRALDEIHAELLPQDKVRIIKELKIRGPTAMIGDGVNDAPALATADIGISMGISGSALATETGHITLMSNDIRKVPQAIRLARKTLWKIRQNVALSFVTKAAILILAFCGHPILWAAVLADVGTCLLVIFNSMLILGTRMNKRKCHTHHNHTDHVHEKTCSHDHHHSHKKHVHEKTCSGNHTDHVSEEACCSPKDDHSCTRRRSACQTGESNLCLVKCDDHQGCSPVSRASPLQVNRVHTEVNRNGGNVHDEHVGCNGSSRNSHHGSNSVCLHNRHSQLNHVQEKKCNSGVTKKSNCCSGKCIEPKGCHSLGNESQSHVIDISKFVKEAQTSENSSNDEQSTVAEKVRTRNSTEAACQQHHHRHHSHSDHHHSHKDHVHEKTCSGSHADHVNEETCCEPMDDHSCTRRRSACQTVESNLCLVECDDHKGCSTVSHASPSQVNRVHTQVHRSEGNIHDEHVICDGSSHNNHHGSNSGCLHDQRSHLNHIQEKKCNSVTKKNGCCSVAGTESKECHNLVSESTSHVIDITKVVREVQTSENIPNGEHSTIAEKVLTRDSNEAACQGHHHHHHHHQSDDQSQHHHIHSEHSDGLHHHHHHHHHADVDHQDPLPNGSESSKGICSEELKSMHICSRLDRRGVGGCCSSYRRECGGMHGCLGHGTGGITEIISE